MSTSGTKHSLRWITSFTAVLITRLFKPEERSDILLLKQTSQYILIILLNHTYLNLRNMTINGKTLPVFYVCFIHQMETGAIKKIMSWNMARCPQIFSNHWVWFKYFHKSLLLKDQSLYSYVPLLHSRSKASTMDPEWMCLLILMFTLEEFNQIIRIHDLK